jgi:nucleoside-diphosphate-sugar epimerase
MRLLVTGHEGLVGKAFCDLCRATGVEVRGLDIRGAEPRDIRDRDAVAELLDDIDGVVHLAAISRVAWGESHPDLCSSVNVDGTAVLLETIRRRSPRAWMLFASSREVYGNPVRAQVREDDPLAPVNTYGRSKLEGERLIGQARAAGLTAAILRLSNVYGGRGDHPDRAIPALTGRALDGDVLRITGGSHYFDFVHVGDVAEALLKTANLLDQGAQDLPIAHLTTGIPTSLLELARLAVAVTGSAATIEEVGARDFDVSGFCGDPAAAAKLFGWDPKIALRQGLAMVADDLRHNGPLPAAEPFGLLR